MKLTMTMPHARRIASALIILSATLAQPALAADAAKATDLSELAQKSGCFSCHKGAGQSIGPAYKEVAQRYASQKDAERLLEKHILGGTGPNGTGWMAQGKASLPLMPANAHVTKKNAAKLARWILTVKDEVVDESKYVTESLTISGNVEHPLRLTVADLKKHPQIEVGESRLTCQSGADHGKLENYKGVRLRDLIEEAKVLAPSHNDVKKTIVIATASDDYKVVFSWNELFNSVLGEGVIVFFEKDGLPLGDDEGRIALISNQDIRTGPRHVKWLKTVEIRKIAD